MQRQPGREHLFRGLGGGQTSAIRLSQIPLIGVLACGSKINISNLLENMGELYQA